MFCVSHRWIFLWVFVCGLFGNLVQANAQEACIPANLMMVVDTSCSMAGDKMAALKRALNTIVTEYKGRLRMGLITFSGNTPVLEMPLGPLDLRIPKDNETHTQQMLQKVRDLKVGGATPLLEAIRFTRYHLAEALSKFPAHQLTDTESAQRTFVLLMTDGWSSSAFGDSLIEMQRMTRLWVGVKKYFIRTFVVGFGEGFELNPNQLGSMAAIGEMGNWIHVKKGSELTQALGLIPAQLSRELCNKKDDNCNGKIDEELTDKCKTDCGEGTTTCNNGNWSPCTAPKPAAELCNGKDDDCDGMIDEGTLCPGGRCIPTGGKKACTQECDKIPCPKGLLCHPDTKACVKVIEKTVGSCHQDKDCKTQGYVCYQQKCIDGKIAPSGCQCSATGTRTDETGIFFLLLAFLASIRLRRRKR